MGNEIPWSPQTVTITKATETLEGMITLKHMDYMSPNAVNWTYKTPHG